MNEPKPNEGLKPPVKDRYVDSTWEDLVFEIDCLTQENSKQREVIRDLVEKLKKMGFEGTAIKRAEDVLK